MMRSSRAVRERCDAVREICQLLLLAYRGVGEIQPAGRGRAVVEVNWDPQLLAEVRARCQAMGVDFDAALEQTLQQITWRLQSELDQRED